MNHSRILLLLAISALAGCNSMIDPYKTYSDTGHPIANTAVLIAFDNHNSDSWTNSNAVVISTDGTPFGCNPRELSSDKCPWWVRVKPGNHSFEILYRTDFRPGVTLSIVEFSAWKLPFEISDMQAGHTYLVKVERFGGRAKATYEDLGRNSMHGIRPCDGCKYMNTPMFN